MAIWVIKDGQREGPYEEQDVRELIYEGTYTDADTAIRGGQFDWTTLGQVLNRRPPELPTALDGADEIAPDYPHPEGEFNESTIEPPPMPAELALAAPTAPAASVAATSAEPARVSVVDFQMPFSSMVIFLIKWALAAIPAAIILAIAVAIFWALALFLIVGSAALHR